MKKVAGPINKQKIPKGIIKHKCTLTICLQIAKIISYTSCVKLLWIMLLNWPTTAVPSTLWVWLGLICLSLRWKSCSLLFKWFGRSLRSLPIIIWKSHASGRDKNAFMKSVLSNNYWDIFFYAKPSQPPTHSLTPSVAVGWTQNDTLEYCCPENVIYLLH